MMCDDRYARADRENKLNSNTQWETKSEFELHRHQYKGKNQTRARVQIHAKWNSYRIQIREQEYKFMQNGIPIEYKFVHNRIPTQKGNWTYRHADIHKRDNQN